MPETIIELRGVHKAFAEHVVYRDMNLQVYTGETLTVIGGSGQGKSVCLKLMTGLLRAEQGEVLFDGEDVGEMGQRQLVALRRRMSMVFQGGALFDSMNVLENVGYALKEHTKMSDAEILARALECLELVGLGSDPNLIYRMPASLSGGMRKRVAIARSIAIKPEVILYDEPTTGLDPMNCNVIAHMILKLQRELGVTSIVVTHEMPLAFEVSDRIAMLHDKHFPFQGTPDELHRMSEPAVKDFIEGRVEEGDEGHGA
ncbi:MAG: ABC transporter ATP-binding protein [Myxococcales bacterium]|nr:ABC transporter ATP-binding protein [Myxococcales bacterium]MCB9753511.1 ABC transporter ATP-binding protein [Myxococcales bacterium]